MLVLDDIDLKSTSTHMTHHESSKTTTESTFSFKLKVYNSYVNSCVSAVSLAKAHAAKVEGKEKQRASLMAERQSAYDDQFQQDVDYFKKHGKPGSKNFPHFWFSKTFQLHC